jgi:hypothetical protein
MDDILYQVMLLVLTAFILAVLLLSFWTLSLWTASMLLRPRRKPDEHKGRKDKKTELHPGAELPPKWVVWGRRETRKKIEGWEPYYVGDDPELMINQARVEFPAKAFGLILLENGVDPARVYKG